MFLIDLILVGWANRDPVKRAQDRAFEQAAIETMRRGEQHREEVNARRAAHDRHLSGKR